MASSIKRLTVFLIFDLRKTQRVDMIWQEFFFYKKMTATKSLICSCAMLHCYSPTKYSLFPLSLEFVLENLYSELRQEEEIKCNKTRKEEFAIDTLQRLKEAQPKTHFRC